MALVKKKEDIFFTLFKEFSQSLKEMAVEFGKFFNGFPADPGYAVILKEFETKCDIKKHRIMEELNSSFVTPFDREDIFAISEQLDDIADFMEDIVSKFGTLNVTDMRDYAKEFCGIIIEMVNSVDRLFIALPDSKHTGDTKTAIIEMNELEDKGDIVYNHALSDLFRNEKDPIEIIKWKEIYEQLEGTLDAGEHLADTIEGILTKNA
jgi:Phosphate transport regulator (distant homolog of PhoU)